MLVDQSTVPMTEAASQFNGHAHKVNEDVAAAAGEASNPAESTALAAAVTMRCLRDIVASVVRAHGTIYSLSI
jgi:hypothetical protein